MDMAPAHMATETPKKLLGVVAMQNINNASSVSRMGSCGLVKWCYSMSRLILLRPLRDRADMVVLTNDVVAVRSLCLPAKHAGASLRLLPLDAALGPAIARWTAMLNYSSFYWPRALSLRALYKLQLFRMTEYAAILFTDVDVDDIAGTILRASDSIRGRDLERAWSQGLSHFLNSSVGLVASPDYHSPINTGVLLLKPSMSIFEHGLSILLRGRFDRLQGFEMSGRPREALAHLQTAYGWMRINSTDMLRKNNWNFVGGHACQGLFVYLFLVRGDARMSYFRFPLNSTVRKELGLGTMKLRHFSSGAKPWLGKVRCPQYFSFMSQPDAPPGSLAATGECWRTLATKRQCLRRNLDKVNFAANCKVCRKLKMANFCSGRDANCLGTDILVF